MSGIAGYVKNKKKIDNCVGDMAASLRLIENDSTNIYSNQWIAFSRVHHGVINPQTKNRGDDSS